ncbi:solute carrier organic anion transporter family member 4A1-like [Diadema antillarum]|uniref:solute carrier organic anion transporter family member 4A1-like n=2 Tax=Diadema antillarum TaxID=105358 RepID=UPI003A840742
MELVYHKLDGSIDEELPAPGDEYVPTNSSWLSKNKFVDEPKTDPSTCIPFESDTESSKGPFGNYPLTTSAIDPCEDDDDDDVATITTGKCGWGKFTPKCLQMFLNVKIYIAVFVMASIIQIMTAYGLISIAITTIERRFHLTSFQSGSIMSAYQFATMAFTVFVTYIGENRHRPRWVGVGSLFLAMGSVIFTLPHFLSNNYQYQEYGTESDGICPTYNDSLNETQPNSCQEAENNTAGKEDNFYWLFILAQIINSLAAAPLFTLGVTYMDDNLSARNFGLVMGCMNALMVVGPALGFVIGSVSLSMYTDFHRSTESVTLTPGNPLWIGAWWLGFLISACLVTPIAVILLAFPKELPGTKAMLEQRRNQAQKGSEFYSRPGFGNSMKDLPNALAKIFTNIPFMGLCFIAVTEYFISAGLFLFFPKFFEIQFGISPRDVGMYVGIIGTSAHFIGAIAAGLLMKVLKLECKGMMKLAMTAVASSMIFALAFIMHCPNVPLAGVTVNYINTSVSIVNGERGLTAPCNFHCSCSNYYEPVCGDDSVMYFSPCHAGCSEEMSDVDGKKVYSGCLCIPSYENITGSTTTYSGDYLHNGHMLLGGNAVPGTCQTLCAKKWPYMILLWLFSFCMPLIGLPCWIATMRCVSSSQRAFALGVQSLFYGGLGTAPGPIIFGLVIDQACILWDISLCDGAGACLVYDNASFANSLLTFLLSFKAVSIIVFFITIRSYKPVEAENKAGDIYKPKHKPEIQ